MSVASMCAFLPPGAAFAVALVVSRARASASWRCSAADGAPPPAWQEEAGRIGRRQST